MPLTTVTGGSKDATRQLLQPVIPGLTMPVGHIWYYLLSLAICATIHELGHALAASFSRVPLRQFGVFIMGIYPGAFVDLEATELEKRPVIEQLRIVCAGVWHNAVTAMCIYLLVYSGAMSKFFEAAGWQKIDGVAIVEIQKTSPLFGRVPELSIIWQIDDIRLDENGKRGGSAVARWTRALTATRRNAETVEQGFCAVQAENVDDGLCCEMSPQYPMGESPDTEIFCFEPYHSSNATTGKAPVTRRKRSQLPLLTSEPQWPSMCFDLRTVLERTGSLRCHTSAECPGTLPVCVLPRSPYPESRAMRIYYTTPTGSQEMTIYVGSLDRLWLDIHVSSLVPPKYDWVPKNMPAWCDALGKYLLSFSIALCLLNALPAWYLDGDHALKLLLVSGAESNKAEKKDGERVMGGQAERVHAVVTMVTTALLAWCIGGSVLLLVL
ncbi:hypothetical protein FBU59_003865 [Linderina macrospora]|uniref:Uncharacterized protein n=1 Tax=Linderina macrospora TaxID=4868 RepID=A0ACC1J755_9FUNG|nr:hypothetical protein FBU59_003865 [Linderina macrospora]